MNSEESSGQKSKSPEPEPIPQGDHAAEAQTEGQPHENQPARHAAWRFKRVWGVPELLTTLLILITGAYVSVSYCQLRALQETNRLTRRALKLAQYNADKALAETQKNNSDTARATSDALKATRDQIASFQTVEGANLGVGRPAMLGEDIGIPIENYGRLPSPKARVFVHVTRFLAKDKTVLYTKHHELGGDRTLIPPGAGRYGVTVRHEMKPGDVERIALGEVEMWIGITLRYDNGFGTESQLGFCWRYAGGVKWDACPTVKHADLQKPPQ